MSKKSCRFNKQLSTELFFLILAVILLLSYQLIYWNKTYPITEGWGINYANLIASGKFPYRDFYYYLPPLNLLIDSILWKFSFGYLLVYRMWRILERFLILSFLYKALLKVTPPYLACFLAFIGITIGSGTTYDLFGDYNQTCELLVAILLNLLLRYTDYFNKDHKKEILCLFLLGITIGFSFLLKQTIFVASIIITFILLTTLFIIQKKDNYIKSIVITALGFLIPVIACVVTLVANDALIPFFEQVFLYTDGKSISLFSTLISIIRVTVSQKTIYMTVILLYCFYRIAQKNTYHNWLFLFLAFSSVYLMYETRLSAYTSLAQTNKGKLTVLILSLASIIALFLDNFSINNRTLTYITYLGYSCLIIFLLYYLRKHAQIAVRIHTGRDLFVMPNIMSAVYCALCFACIVYQFQQYKITHSITCLYWIMLLSCSLILMYHLVMGAQDNFNMRALTLCVPVLLCYTFEHIPHHFFFKSVLLLSCITIICVGIASQKITGAYSWWGCTSSVLDETHNCTPAIKSMKGLRLSADEATMYNTLYSVLKENTDANTSVYSFPHIQIFNVLLNNTNQAGFVPVPFYDVVDSRYILADVDTLSRNMPDILVWCDIPNAMASHESIFRTGKPLAQRQIQSLFSNAIHNGKYTLIGQYNNIFIYKRTDSISDAECTYTYIQDVSRTNSSL